MFEGTLAEIYLGARKAEPLERVEQVEAVAGSGLTGDRYFLKAGTFSVPGKPDREVTLIEAEALEALAREYDVALQAGQSRRNLVTRGVPLNHLVGKEFRVGAVVLRGIRLCEPCGHLEKLTIPGVEKGLRHRGGLERQLDLPGLQQAPTQALVPRHRPSGGEHPIDEADRCACVGHGVEHAQHSRQALQLGRALGAPCEMALHGGALGGRQLAIEQGRMELAILGAGHVRYRSSFSLRSSRARCSRDRTVPSSRPSAAAISS